MTAEHPQSPSDPRSVEQVIVLQLLRDDHDQRWSRTELAGEINDTEPSALSSAIENLERHGVVAIQGEHVIASRCARRLDELGLVGV